MLRSIDPVRTIVGILVALFVFSFFSSCSNVTRLEKRNVTVTDECGLPIAGASVFPQPFVAGSKQSTDSGSLWVYVLDPTRRFRLNAVGFRSEWFDFDRPDKVCVLKRMKQSGRK
jgi:hypothetical protein